MVEFLLTHEPVIRLSVFLGLLAAMMAWELIAPKRVLTQSRPMRWSANLGIVVVNTLVVRVAVPVLPVAFALHAESQGWGLLNTIALPQGLAIAAAFLLLDLAIYGQHIAFHKIPLLWRLHRMHHADLDFDATTGIRFHPIEILISIAVKLALVALIGAPAAAVIVFEVVLNATSVFNHANVRLPQALDAVLRLIVVTPDMHRVHHSQKRFETDSNFGFNLPWWDRLFRTYRAQPEDGHAAMAIGIPEFTEPKELRLDKLLTQPFRDPP